MKKYFQIFALVAVMALGLTLAGCDKIGGLVSKSDSTTTAAEVTTATQGQTTAAPTTVAPTSVATTTVATTTVIPTTTAHVHQYGDWTVVTPSSCNAEGLEERTCTCGAKETQAVAMDPHAMVSVEAKEATFEAAGNIAYDQCQNCQKIFVDGKEATLEDVTIPQLQIIKVADAVEIINALDYTGGSVSTEETYYVKGIVVKGAYFAKSSSYTLYIADAIDSEVLLQIYSPKNDAPQYYVGQEITIQGTLMAYVKNDVMTPESSKPTVIAQSTTNQAIVRGTEEAPLTVSEAVESIKLSILPDTEASVVKAIVKEVKSSSFVITDGTAELTVYTKPTAEVVVGEEIVVTGKYCAYYETMEMTNNTWVINHKMAAYQDNTGVLEGVLKSGVKCGVCGKMEGEETVVNLDLYDLIKVATGFKAGDTTTYAYDAATSTITVNKMSTSVNQWCRVDFNKVSTDYKYAYLVVKGSAGMCVGAKVDTNSDPKNNAFDQTQGNKVYKGASEQVAIVVWDLEAIGISASKLEKIVLWAYAAKDSGATSGTIEILGAGFANVKAAAAPTATLVYNGETMGTLSADADGMIAKPELNVNVISGELVWYNGEEEFDFTKPITADVTLTAKYVKSEGTSGAGALENAFDKLTTVAEAGEVFAQREKGNKYLAVRIYVGHGDSSTVWLGGQILGRHIMILNNGLSIYSLDGSWTSDYQTIPRDGFQIFDENGTLINDYIGTWVSGLSQLGGDKAGVMQEGRWYTLLINADIQWLYGDAKYNDEWFQTNAQHIFLSTYKTTSDAYFEVVGYYASAADFLGITLDKSSAALDAGKEVQLTATLGKGVEGTINWTTSDSTVATVDQTGKVTAVANGTAIISATINGKTAQCEVTVMATVKELSCVPVLALSKTPGDESTSVLHTYDASKTMDVDYIILPDAKEYEGFNAIKFDITVKEGYGSGYLQLAEGPASYNDAWALGTGTTGIEIGKGVAAAQNYSTGGDQITYVKTDASALKIEKNGVEIDYSQGIDWEVGATYTITYKLAASKSLSIWYGNRTGLNMYWGWTSADYYDVLDAFAFGKIYATVM